MIFADWTTADMSTITSMRFIFSWAVGARTQASALNL